MVQELFEGLHRNGYIVPKTTMGAISPSTGRTLPDRYIEGTCPICGYDSARGDQCDNCGNQLDPIDLINPTSKINGETPKFVETEHFFLDLPALADALRQWLDTREGWRPNVLRFSRNLLDDLQPRAITRDLEWGVPIPLDGWRDRPDKRIYVWFDAVIGYLSASIEWARRSGDPEAWRKWWSADAEGKDARGYYFMGKDNIVFHSVIWPAMLLGYTGEGDRDGEPGELGRLNLPTEVVSSEYLTMEGRKFSSSRKVVIYVRDFLERYDADALRYFIAVAGPESNDTDFTWAEFLRRNNDELVAGWGNLVNRSISMAAKNFGAIPPVDPAGLTEADEALLAAARAGFATVGDLIARHRQKQAIGEAMRVVAEANKYLSEQAPVEAQGRGRQAADGHHPARRAAGGQRRQHAAHPVPAALRAEDPRAARRHRRARADAGDRGGRRPRRRAGVPGADRRLHRRRALGVGADRGRPRRWPRRSRSSASSTRPSSTRSWPGWPADAAAPPTAAARAIRPGAPRRASASGAGPWRRRADELHDRLVRPRSGASTGVPCGAPGSVISLLSGSIGLQPLPGHRVRQHAVLVALDDQHRHVDAAAGRPRKSVSQASTQSCGARSARRLRADVPVRPVRPPR